MNFLIRNVYEKKSLAQFFLIMWILIIAGGLKLSNLKVESSSILVLNGEYCVNLPPLTLIVKVANQKSIFIVKGSGTETSTPIQRRVSESGTYLQAVDLNPRELQVSYYSKVRPLFYRKDGTLRAFRYNNMVFDSLGCGASHG